MKNYLLLFSCVLLLGLWSCGGISVDEKGPGTENPDPDPNPEPEDDLFETYLLANFDTDSDGAISIREADAVTHITCSDMKIKTLTRIARFRNLERLECKYNNLTSLDLSSNTALTYVDCGVNNLSQLNISGCTQLETIICDRNAITTLNLASNTRLTVLNCAENKIVSLDVCANSALSSLNCVSNGMKSIWVRSGQTIDTVSKDGDTVIVPVEDFQYYLIEQFDTNKDGLLSDAEVAQVVEINCSGKQSAPTCDVSRFVNLKRLNCAGCGITSLDVTKNTVLEALDCRQNAGLKLTTVWARVIPTFDCDSDVTVEFQGRPTTFAVGDPYYGVSGPIGMVAVGGASGKLISLKTTKSVWADSTCDEVEIGTNDDADGSKNMDIARKSPHFPNLTIFQYAYAYGDGGWYVPALQELVGLWDNYSQLNKGLEILGGDLMDRDYDYWSSIEFSSYSSYYVYSSYYDSSSKSNMLNVILMRKY